MISRSSSSFSEEEYDVFLSFRGKDTRNNFTSHLYAALCRKKVETFMDDEELERGEEIKQSLIEAIEASLLWVVIFSEDYASSRWCLDELEKILECKKKYGRIVIPVFYHVHPTDVRKQTGSYGAAFANHEKVLKRSSDKLQNWRAALTEVAGQAGYDSNVIRNEAKLIERIVEDIIKRLCKMSPSVNEDRLVGIQSRIMKMESLLSIGSKGVRLVGILGMGGIGKTTLARAIFNKISNQFEIFYFAESVRESEEKDRLVGLRQELFSAMLEDKNLNIAILNLQLAHIRKRLKRKNALIVMDDVTHFRQIESLIDDFDLFGSRSRFIITTRDERVLMNSGVNDIYNLGGLRHNDAIKLFNMYAFSRNHPMENFHQLSDRIVRHFDGIPLAIKIFGSLLQGREIQKWEETVNQLQRNLPVDVQKVLKISYDGLEDEVQHIFLDIACFFKHTRRDLVINVLNASGFSTGYAIDILVERCLITRSILRDEFTMHDLVQQMAQEIMVHGTNTHLGKRSRLWRQEDICQVLTRNMGTEKIEGIFLNMQGMKEIHLHPDVFAKMPNLRIFKFCNSDCEANINKVYVSDHGLVSNISRLTYLQWDGCPLKYMQTSFHLSNLVVLRMPNSNVEELWNGIQSFPNLKDLDVSFSEQLTKIPDLSQAPNLERLILSGCKSLVEVHTSIQHLEKLVIFDLSYCKTLRNIPTCIHLLHLNDLNLFGCSNLMMLPEVPCNLVSLNASGTAIEELPSSVSCLSRLSELRLENCSRLKSLSISFSKLISLRYLHLKGCSKLDQLTAIGEQPSSIAYLQELDAPNGPLKELPEDNLTILDLSGTAIKSLPERISHHKKLWSLDISHCQELLSLPELPPNLQDLDANSCTSLDLGPSSELCNSFTNSKARRRHVNFLNCFKLDNNKLDENMKDVLKRFHQKHSGVYYSKKCDLERFGKPANDRDRLGVEGIQDKIGILAQQSDLTLDDILKTVEKLADVEEIDWVPNFLKDAQQGSGDETTWRIASYVLFILEEAAHLITGGFDPDPLDYFYDIKSVALEWLSSIAADGEVTLLVEDLIVDAAKEVVRAIQYPIDSYEICYPGNQIPEWLTFQGEGPTVTLELKTGSAFGYSLGFIACAVVSFKDCYFDGKKDIFIECKCRLPQHFCAIDMSKMEVLTPNLRLDSDQVFLGFFSGFYFKDCYRDKASFEFSVLDSFYKPLELSEVKKCGVRFVLP